MNKHHQHNTLRLTALLTVIAVFSVGIVGFATMEHAADSHQNCFATAGAGNDCDSKIPDENNNVVLHFQLLQKLTEASFNKNINAVFVMIAIALIFLGAALPGQNNVIFVRAKLWLWFQKISHYFRKIKFWLQLHQKRDCLLAQPGA